MTNSLNLVKLTNSSIPQSKMMEQPVLRSVLWMLVKGSLVLALAMAIGRGLKDSLLQA